MRKVPISGPDPRLAGVVLAAGAAQRFGSAKQVLAWEGETLVARSARLAADCCGAGVTVVTGAHEETVRAAVGDTAVTLVSNPDWQRGLASSLRRGLAATPGQAEAVMVLLIDQPLIPGAHYRALLAAWQARPDAPVATDYGSRAGVPAILPVSLLEGLEDLQGDRGAAAWLSSRPDCVRVACDGAEHDIDTPEDWARLTRSRLQ